MLATVMMVGAIEDAVGGFLVACAGLPNQPVNMKVNNPIRMMVTP